MRNAKFLPAIILLAFFSVSCKETNTVLEEGFFYAQNTETKKYYTVSAEMLATGKKCVIWAEKGNGVTRAKAEEIAAIYDNNIRPKIVGAFGKKNFYTDSAGIEYKDGSSTGPKSYFNDILDYANRLVGRNDGKLTILLLDIKDGFKDPKTDSYVAGYFSGGNFLPNRTFSNSNYRDMIYIDTYPGLRLFPEEVYATLAHELQHLINFVTTWLMDKSYTDTWIDEGLSAWAEYLFYDNNLTDRCKWFIKDEKGTIAKGNNFFVWGNHVDEEPQSILDEYATVYLFFRWLYLQAKEKNLHENIFYEIITSGDYDHRAVTGVAKKINSDWGTWENLLRTWLAANYYPGNSYGYTGDNYLMDNIKVKTITGESIELYPGEGVYSVNSGSFTPKETGINIRYAGLSENRSAINTSLPYAGNTLLTFNSGTNLNGKEETGYLTGLISFIPQTFANEIQPVEIEDSTAPDRPYRLDARDVLGRNRNTELQGFRPGPLRER